MHRRVCSRSSPSLCALAYEFVGLQRVDNEHNGELDPPTICSIRHSYNNSRIHRHPEPRRSAVNYSCMSHISKFGFIHSPFRFIFTQKLNSFTRAPDYIAYLAYILAALTQEEERIRTIAGYLLKNNAPLIHRASPEVVAFVKAAVLQAFSDSATMIRNAAVQDIVAFLGILEPRNWPECLQHLVNALDANNLDQQEVSIFVPFDAKITPSFVSKRSEVMWRSSVV